MEKKNIIIFLIIIGLSILYVALAFLVFISRGKWGNLIKKKIMVSTLLISLSAIFNYSAFAQTKTLPDSTTDTINSTLSRFTSPPRQYLAGEPTLTPNLTRYGIIPPTPSSIMTLAVYAIPTPTPMYGTRPPTPTNVQTLYGILTPTPVSGKGDVDNNGTVDIVDALKVAQYTVGNTPPDFDPSKADVDNSGTINIVDALCIAQKYVGIIDEFPDNSKK